MNNDFLVLLERAKNGDGEAFTQIIEPEYKKLYNICYKFTGNPIEAEDLMQDVVLKVFRNIGSFRQEAKFSSWIYQIATNTYKDSVRKNKLNNLSLDETYDDSGESIIQVVEDTTTEEIYETKELQRYIGGLIDDLPLAFREVIVLREILDYSYEEIGEKLEISIGTVKSRISRGRKILKEKILEIQEQNPDFISHNSINNIGGERR